MFKKGKILFCFIFAFIFLNLSFAQTGGWGSQNSGTNALLMDVFFINADTGWVAGHNTILKTTDGGENWIVLDSSRREYWSIHFTDKDHGWAVGYKESGLHGFIYQTTDGGQQWSFGDSTQYELNDVFFVDENTGFAVGGGRPKATILRTTNAGADWEELDTWGTQLYTVYFHNDTLGWAAGADGKILKTEDGGDTWNNSYVNIGLYQSIKDIQFVNQDTGWVVGGDSIYKTTNGGDTWESLEGLSNHSYHCCFFINSDVGWAGAAAEDYMAKILYTEDGGNSWQVQESLGIHNSLSSFFFVDHKTGWCIGSSGNILKTSSGGIVAVEDVKQSLVPERIGLHQNYPNPFSSLTTISYDLPVSGHISLVVYNVQGKEVIRLVDGKQPAGKHNVLFDGTGLAGGVYYYKLTDARKQMVKKMLLLK